jgi:glycosyltransferase involved in cell wall biosynthesis
MRTDSDFCISVIIPVYNAEMYIEKAINSAINQQDVSEVIVVDDGSTDKSFSICKRLESSNLKIQVWQHPDRANHGRSATRNFGISKATSPFIAFLDADDFFLPGRFETDKEKFKKYPEIDGVYNAIGAKFYRKAVRGEMERLKLITVTDYVEHEDLFKTMYPIGHLGYFSGIGLTVKKSLLQVTGTFSENLEVAEDTELWVRMSLIGKLIPGEIKKPVAMRGVHGKNVSFRDKSLYLINNEKMFENLLGWAFKNKISSKNINILWERNCRIRKNNGHSSLEITSFVSKNIQQYPSLLFSKHTYRYLPFLREIKNILTFQNIREIK